MEKPKVTKEFRRNSIIYVVPLEPHFKPRVDKHKKPEQVTPALIIEWFEDGEITTRYEKHYSF